MRRWLHLHGIHRFCRIKRVPIAWDFSKQYLRSFDGGLIDITTFGGVPTAWKEVHV